MNRSELLRSILKYLLQLVGTVLIVLVKAELTGVIRNVEATVRKVGAFRSLFQGLLYKSFRLVCAVCLGTKEQWAYGWSITIQVSVF